jgi:hypothetical protein
MERGQVTIEMIFIFGLFILLVFSISVPSVLKGERYAKDVQYASDAKFASERLVTIASSISNPYEKRNVEIYIPGHYSGNLSDPTSPALLRAMCIDAEGSSINTFFAIVRQNSDGMMIQDEDYEFSKNLSAGDWKIYVNTGSGYQEGAIYEYSGGRRYSLTISQGNITSHTIPTYIISDCDDAGNEFGGP